MGSVVSFLTIIGLMTAWAVIVTVISEATMEKPSADPNTEPERYLAQVEHQKRARAVTKATAIFPFLVYALYHFAQIFM